MSTVARIALMLAALAIGRVWMTPRDAEHAVDDVLFTEQAASAGCDHHHTMVSLASVFDNIMPWLSSVGAAAAAADYDADGDADLYVTSSGRGERNRLFRNHGDGTFEDVTDAAGVACGNPEGASMHAVWGDVDNDGDLDLYVVKWAERNTLFLNHGDGTFADVSAIAGVDYWGYGNGATFLDYDRDGHLDILVGNYFCETVVDPKTGQRVRNDLWNPVTTRVMHETFTHADNGGRNVLYRNRGDGTFEDVTERVGLTFTGWTLAVGSGDLNNDNWPDLYLANDFGPDELYLNTGATENPPRFRLVVDPRGHPGVGNDWWKGMNVDMGDVNNDGYLDLYVTNILERRYKTDEGNMLWINCADPLCPGGRGFLNLAEASGTHDGGWGWGGKFADFNNDGLLDLYTVNGFVTGDPDRNYWYQIQDMVTQTKNQTADAADWPVMGTRDLSGRERGRLFIQVPRRKSTDDATTATTTGARGRTAAPRFVEVARQAGISDTYNGRGIAVADFNLDGYVDLYVANQGAPSCYYVNRSAQRSRAERAAPGFMRIKLVGRPGEPLAVADRVFASARDAVGARVILSTSAGQLMREVQGGMGFASQSEHTLHFGLPIDAELQGIEVRWPSGRVQTLPASVAETLRNQHVEIVEGDVPRVLYFARAASTAPSS